MELTGANFLRVIPAEVVFYQLKQSPVVYAVEYVKLVFTNKAQSSRNFHFSCHTRVLHQGRLCTRQRVFSLTSLAAISVYMIATYRCYTSESNLNGCNFRKESRRKLFYIPKESAKIAAFDSTIIEFSALYHRFMFIGVYLKTTNCGIWSLFAYPVTNVITAVGPSVLW